MNILNYELNLLIALKTFKRIFNVIRLELRCVIIYNKLNIPFIKYISKLIELSLKALYIIFLPLIFIFTENFLFLKV